VSQRAIKFIKRVPAIIAGLWLAFMGAIASFMLYNEIFDPQWGRQAKERFPDPPDWYVLVFVALAAAACFYLAYLLIRPRRNKDLAPDSKKDRPSQ